MPHNRSPFTLRAALRRQAVLTSALIALVAIVAVGALGRAPVAGVALAVLLAVLGILRATLSTRAVGALAVRSRGMDAGVLLVLAVAIGILSTAPNL